MVGPLPSSEGRRRRLIDCGAVGAAGAKRTVDSRGVNAWPCLAARYQSCKTCRMPDDMLLMILASMMPVALLTGIGVVIYYTTRR